VATAHSEEQYPSPGGAAASVLQVTSEMKQMNFIQKNIPIHDESSQSELEESIKDTSHYFNCRAGR
jgi:hypothetical protein